MKKNFKIILSSILVGISLTVYGINKEKNNQKVKDGGIEETNCEEKTNDIINNKALNKAILTSLNQNSFSVQDLEKVDYLYIEFDDNLDEINKCINLEELEIVGSSQEHDYNLDNLNLPNLKKLVLFGVEDEFNFLKNSPQIEEIELTCLDNINVDFLKKLPNLKKITINECENIRNFNSDDFPNLKSISLNNISKSLSFLKYFNYEEIVKMENKGININFNYSFETVKEYSSKINEIIKSFGNVTNLTDEEKIDKVLIYVLDNLVYDGEVDKNSEQAEKLADMYNSDKIKYALDDDPLAICCNYAEITTLLLNAVGVETYSVYNVDHMWNLVKVNNEYKYFDLTWLDQDVNAVKLIKENRKNDLIWYKVDTEQVSLLDDSGMHDLAEIPAQIEDKLEEQQTLKLSK